MKFEVENLKFDNMFDVIKLVSQRGYISTLINRIFENSREVYKQTDECFSPLFFNQKYKTLNVDLNFLILSNLNVILENGGTENQIENFKILFDENLSSKFIDNVKFFLEVLKFLGLSIASKNTIYSKIILKKESKNYYYLINSINVYISSIDEYITKERREEEIEFLLTKNSGIESIAFGVTQSKITKKEIERKGYELITMKDLIS